MSVLVAKKKKKQIIVRLIIAAVVIIIIIIKNIKGMIMLRPSRLTIIHVKTNMDEEYTRIRHRLTKHESSFREKSHPELKEPAAVTQK